MNLLPVEDALKVILAATSTTKKEKVAIANAAGRVLAQDAVASFSQPPFDGSAMDGYALKAAEGQKGAKLKVVGTSAAGEGFDGEVKSGECTRIYTGAPIPNGTDAVIMQEQVDHDGDFITINEDVSPTQNVRFAGNDFKEGTTIIASGTKLSPFHTTLAAAANFAELEVYAQPKITMLGTGDELVAPGGTLQKDQIIASNSYGLLPLFAQYGAKIEDKGIIKDDPQTLKNALRKALDEQPDILVTTGGASVGDRDYVKPMLEELGVKLDFWKIAVRPGKPLMFANYGNTLIFGLPGNPVSALVTASVFVLPAIKALQSLAPAHRTYFLPLKDDLKPNGPREFYHRAKLTNDSDNKLIVDASRAIDSAHLSSLSTCDCFVKQKPFCERKKQGDLVEVILMPWAAG
jgi:molybdopterin molybdotransferase